MSLTSVASLSTEYQVLLEKHRLDPDDETTWQLLEQTSQELQIAHAVYQATGGRVA